MKKKVFVLLFLISNISFGQNYKLFNASAKKLFTNHPVPVNTYSSAFETSVQSNTDSVYFNFSGIDNNYFTSDSCVFWGSPMCLKQNIPSWIGKKIVYDNASTYDLFNLAGDTLKFQFTTNPNDTFLFYKDTSQKFLLVYQNTDTINVLGHNDSARFYKIIHTDLSGNIIYSALNQQNIIVAKTWGLTRFFVVDSFPQILKPLALIGNGSPNAGFNALTNELLYDYQPGDVIQYHKISYQSGGPPWENFSKFIKYTILNRIITADSLIYNAAVEYFYTDSAALHLDTVILKYYRNTVIADIPFELFDGNTRQLKLQDYCGLKLWTYTINSPNNLMFCSQDTCWGDYDTNGPPAQGDAEYVAGLGIYAYSNHLVSPPPNGYSNSSKIVYFKKNGVTCGSVVTIGINENHADDGVLIYPNPAMNAITIESMNTSIIEIINIQGQKIIHQQIQQGKTVVDIGNLAKGVYFLRMLNGDKTEVTRIIKK